MTELQLALVTSGTPKAEKAAADLRSIYQFTPIDRADAIVALGGDGLMLHSLHEYLALGLPIFGVNCGTVGFLMNDYRTDALPERVRAAHEEALFPLQLRLVDRNGEEHQALAFNEVSLIRLTGQSANLRLSVDGVVRLDRLVCDGVLVATPAGSTAYNLSAHGPVLPLSANVLSLTAVSPFRPRRWRGALLPDTSVVELVNLDPEKRPLGVSADFHEFRDVAVVEIRQDRSSPQRILFDRDRTLSERIIGEQFET